MKVKKAIEKGNQDIARIHAENAIRQRSQSLNFLKLASRMDAIAQRMQTAQNMKTVCADICRFLVRFAVVSCGYLCSQLNKSMINVTQVMAQAVKSMDLEKV